METGAFGVKDSIGSYSENYGPHKIGGFASYSNGSYKKFRFFFQIMRPPRLNSPG